VVRNAVLACAKVLPDALLDGWVPARFPVAGLPDQLPVDGHRPAVAESGASDAARPDEMVDARPVLRALPVLALVSAAGKSAAPEPDVQASVFLVRLARSHPAWADAAAEALAPDKPDVGPFAA
jgi:hypothetical protein